MDEYLCTSDPVGKPLVGTSELYRSTNTACARGEYTRAGCYQSVIRLREDRRYSKEKIMEIIWKKLHNALVEKFKKKIQIQNATV